MTERYNANAYVSLGSDSAMIQAAVDEAARRGCRAVVPAENARTGRRLWEIDRTILLPSGCTLVLQGAHLRMADGALGRMFQNRNCLTALGKTPAGRQEDIAILGEGGAILDGGEYPGICEKSWGVPGVPRASDQMLLCFHNVERIRIEGLILRDARFYTMCFLFCSHATIRDLLFQSHCNVPNQDGIDVHIGCSQFLIENIRGCAGDDMVAVTTLDYNIMVEARVEGMSRDIHDIVIRNLQVFSANGCALVRILNHEGYRIYNVTVDGLYETSPWSESDAVTAPNPDLCGDLDERHRFVIRRRQTLGEFGYRTDAAVRIGENFWYGTRPAGPGDTWGITVRNVSTHAQSAVTVCNTLWDSHFEHIRLFGNGFRAVLFNNGDVRNVTFRDLVWTEECRPHREDGQIDIDWNGTHTKGLSAVYFSGTRARNLRFEDMYVGHGHGCVFGGYGDAELLAEKVGAMDGATTLTEDADVSPSLRDRYLLRLRKTEEEKSGIESF